jgi:hypothetical protein
MHCLRCGHCSTFLDGGNSEEVGRGACCRHSTRNLSRCALLLRCSCSALHTPPVQEYAIEWDASEARRVLLGDAGGALYAPLVGASGAAAAAAQQPAAAGAAPAVTGLVLHPSDETLDIMGPPPPQQQQQQAQAGSGGYADVAAAAQAAAVAAQQAQAAADAAAKMAAAGRGSGGGPGGLPCCLSVCLGVVTHSSSSSSSRSSSRSAEHHPCASFWGHNASYPTDHSRSCTVS